MAPSRECERRGGPGRRGWWSHNGLYRKGGQWRKIAQASNGPLPSIPHTASQMRRPPCPRTAILFVMNDSAAFPPDGHVRAENVSKVKVQRPQRDPTASEQTLCSLEQTLTHCSGDSHHCCWCPDETNQRANWGTVFKASNSHKNPKR